MTSLRLCPAAKLALSFLIPQRYLAACVARPHPKILPLYSLCVGSPRVKALAILEMQGYVKPITAKDEWMTTPAGEIVSGSQSPRYSRETIERSLASLADHLKLVNQDSSAEYKIEDAVAFGDFLSKSVRVQAADVGIRLEPRNRAANENSASEHAKQEDFLKLLRGRTPLVNLHPYAEWMGARTHRKLLGPCP